MSLDGMMNERGAGPIHIGGAVACALLLLVGWLMGVQPLMADNQQASSIVDQANDAEQQATQSKNALDQLNVQLEEVRTRLAQQPVSLDTAGQINPLLAQLAEWSEQHNLAITRTNSGQPLALAYYDYVPISLAGEGAYGDLLAFFTRLHEDRGDLGIVSFNVRRLANGAGVSFDLELAWYVLSDQAQSPEGQATALVETN